MQDLSFSVQTKTQRILLLKKIIMIFVRVLRAENELENVFIIIFLLSKLRIEHLDGQPGSMISDILGRNGGTAIPRWQWMGS